MKIAFVLDDTLDSSDGVQQYVLLVSGWLRDRGHEVHYITGNTTRTDLANIHSMAKNVRVRFNRNWLSVPLQARSDEVKRLLTKEAFDVLHIQMPFSPMLAGKVIKYADRDTAIVATYHIAPHSRVVTIANKTLGMIQKKAVARIDSIISVSPVAQEFAQATTGKLSVVIPNSIDTKLWRPSHKQVRKIDIVFLGRLVSRKGCVFLLRALHELKESGRLDTRKVVIAGDGPERKKLELYVESHDLSENVSFMGYESEQEKRKLLQDTKLAVYPSTGGESFGIVLLEAMAAGAIVLAGDNPGYASVVGTVNGSLITPQDTKLFANRLANALADNSKLAELGERQQALLAQYDINTVGGAILAVYEQAKHKRGVQPHVKG